MRDAASDVRPWRTWYSALREDGSGSTALKPPFIGVCIIFALLTVPSPAAVKAVAPAKGASERPVVVKSTTSAGKPGASATSAKGQSGEVSTGTPASTTSGAPPSASAGPTWNVAVAVPDDVYGYYITYRQGGQEKDGKTGSFKGTSQTIDLSTVPKGAQSPRLKLVNSLGFEAVKELPANPGNMDIILSAADFAKLRLVELVLVGKNNEALAAAAIQLKDAAGGTYRAVLDPATKGIVRFNDVTPGKATIMVRYGQDRSASQEIEIPGPANAAEAKTAEPPRPIQVTLPGDAPTVSRAAAGPSMSKTKPEEGVQTSYIANLIALIIVIAAALIAWFIYHLLKSRGVTAKGTLQQLGVDTNVSPGTPAPTEAPAIPSLPPIEAATAVVGTAPAAVAAPGVPRLVGTSGPFGAQVFTVSVPASIGRDETNTIYLAGDSAASRKHARIEGMTGAYSITDQGSSNGTFVNGMKIAGPHPLRPGDEIQVGSSRFRFEV